ncbi:MAG: indole-3-glycerol-phosphate synthase [Clostridiaceae bacterium]
MKKEQTMSHTASCTKCTTALWNQYDSGIIPVIPDIKCKSPGEGDLLLGRNPVGIAADLAAAGAPVISVVTETVHFGGSAELLRQIAKEVRKPVLRKDFITSREQLAESLEIGASGVLLIASMLSLKKLRTLAEEALELGLEPLIETHDEEEIKAVCEWNMTFIGINNRNIAQWEMDGGNVHTTERLAGLIRTGALVLSESSMESPLDVLRATAAGAHAVLVGTAILRADDPVEMYHRLSRARDPGREPSFPVLGR